MKDELGKVFHKRDKDTPNMISLVKQRRPLLEKIIEERNKHLSAIVKLVDEELLFKIRVNAIRHNPTDAIIIDYHLARERYCGDTPPRSHESYLYKQYSPPDPSKWWENAGLPDTLTPARIHHIIHHFSSKGYPPEVVSEGTFKFVV